MVGTRGKAGEEGRRTRRAQMLRRHGCEKIKNCAWEAAAVEIFKFLVVSASLLVQLTTSGNAKLLRIPHGLMLPTG